MSLIKREYTDGVTIITAQNLNDIQDEIIRNAEDIDDMSSHINNHQNPHQVTKEQVGLGNVDNTSDTDKPISSATQDALDQKANGSALTAETERATEAEGDLSDAIAAETERATGIEDEHSSRIEKLESSSEQNANVHMGFFRDAQGYLCEI